MCQNIEHNTTQHHNPYIHSAFREKFNSIWKACIEIPIWIIYFGKFDLFISFSWLRRLWPFIFIFVHYFRQYTEKIQFKIELFVYSVIWNCWSFFHCREWPNESDCYYYMKRTVVWQLQKKKKNANCINGISGDGVISNVYDVRTHSTHNWSCI